MAEKGDKPRAHQIEAAKSERSTCQTCGKPIAYDRLDAIPYVTRCVDCKQDWEEGARAD